MIAHVQTAIRFSEWALEFMLLPPFCFVLAALAVSFVLAALKQRPFQAGLWKPYHWLVLTQCLFFAAAIAVGVLGASPTTNPTIPHHPSRTATLWLNVLDYCSFASCAFGSGA
jgi:hypothetical protein